MTQSELVLGIAVVALAIVAGTLSERYVDRRFAGTPGLQDQHAEPADKPPAESLPAAPSACVNADGSWRNWSSPNVPMLSPKCEDGK